ncbi:hypothetical protein BT69DRAFT_262202 [Atractiella rhizophila]|nr:hypothetical protein BT69DRAFT_262202 [Atractiella rhizophila]
MFNLGEMASVSKSSLESESSRSSVPSTITSSSSLSWASVVGTQNHVKAPSGVASFHYLRRGQSESRYYRSKLDDGPKAWETSSDRRPWKIWQGYDWSLDDRGETRNAKTRDQPGMHRGIDWSGYQSWNVTGAESSVHWQSEYCSPEGNAFQMQPTQQVFTTSFDRPHFTPTAHFSHPSHMKRISSLPTSLLSPVAQIFQPSRPPSPSATKNSETGTASSPSNASDASSDFFSTEWRRYSPPVVLAFTPMFTRFQ